MATRRPPKGLFVGLAAVDLTYTIDKIPRRNEKISVSGQIIAAGGPSANAAITFAFLGGRAALVTAVGAHPLAAIIRNDLHHHAVRLHDLARGRKDSPPVSSILVLRSSGERTVVSANASVFSPIGDTFNPRCLQGVSILQVDGHYMPLCIAAARLARANGIPVVLDSGSWKDGMDELLPFVHTVICSADYRPPGCCDGKDVFEFLAAEGVVRVAITRGAKSIVFRDQAKDGKVMVQKIKPVDTLGAGDIFHGAFCYYASQPNPSFADALAAAARIATLSCQYPGTRQWMRVYANRP